MANIKMGASEYAAIAWFDLFDYPLTRLELEQWRIQLPPLSPRLLKEGGGEVSFLQGFYFLKGRESIIRTRLHRAAIAHQKFKKARRAARIFSVVPFTRMIAVGNTLGYNNARAESDIDFFIVAQSGHIFFVRCFTTLIAKVFGWRPTPQNKQDKICLSFFVADNALNLQSLQEHQLTAQWPHDLYLCFWINQLTILYESHACYEKFITQNAWCNDLLPQVTPQATVVRRTVTIAHSPRILKRGGEWLFKSTLLEYWLTFFQCKYLPLSLQEKIGKGTGVVVTQSVLKFHDNDKRSWFRKEFMKQYEHLVAHH